MSNPGLRIAVGIATKGRPELVGVTLAQLTQQSRCADAGWLCPASPAALPPGCHVVCGPVRLPALRNLASNLVRAAWPEPRVDRRGRLRGNAWALADWLRGRAHPRRILEIGP